MTQERVATELVKLAKELTGWIIEKPIVRDFAFDMAAIATDRYTEWTVDDTSDYAFLLEGQVRHADTMFTAEGDIDGNDLDITVNGFDSKTGESFFIGRREFKNLGRSGASPVAAWVKSTVEGY